MVCIQVVEHRCGCGACDGYNVVGMMLISSEEVPRLLAEGRIMPTRGRVYWSQEGDMIPLYQPTSRLDGETVTLFRGTQFPLETVEYSEGVAALGRL
jgi:hypothetical protein